MPALNRFCIACRRLIPEDIASPLLVLGMAEVKWQVKNHRHVAKLSDEEGYCFCEGCAPKMKELIKNQLEKGAKAI